MNNSKYSVKIFEDLGNEELKKAWQRLEKENDVFPQMYYEWIEPWWRYQKKNRKLHIIAVLAENNEIVGIAPFCIERIYGVKVLRSIPIHFGDFYDFVLTKTINHELYQIVIEYCSSFKNWHVCQVNQVNTTYPIYSELKFKNKPKIKKVSAIIYTDILFQTFNDFLKSISKKQRSEFKRRKRRLSEHGKVELKIIDNPEIYNFYENDMKHIYKKRWNHPESHVNLIFKYRKEAYCDMLTLNKAIGFILLLNEKPIAYRLGFLFNDVFTSWKLVYDPQYSKFSLGNLISAMGIDYLIDKKIIAINNGVGDYSYKRSWFNNRIHSSNVTFYFNNKSLYSFSYYTIENSVKPVIKKLRNELFKYIKKQI